MIKEAVVLAGGFGTRLKTVVSEVPKPMAPINGEPFLLHVLNYLNTEKITHVILAVGYLHETIVNYFGTTYKGMHLFYSIEDEPLGTGGAILKACNLTSTEHIFVINGDTFFNVNLNQLLQFHLNASAQLSVALKPMLQFDRYGTVEINEDGKIIGFLEKQFLEKGLINGGIYCLTKKIFNPSLPEKFSFEKEILEKEFNLGNVYGIVFNNYFIDIGIPEDFEKAQHDFKQHLQLI